MRRPLARKAAEVRTERANLAPILVALGARWRTVPYAKAARYDGASRVGALGLVQEGVGSLLLTGAAASGARAAAAIVLAGAVALRRARPVAIVGAVALLVGARVAERRARRALGTGEVP
jgi:hypothetical protein